MTKGGKLLPGADGDGRPCQPVIFIKSPLPPPQPFLQVNLGKPVPTIFIQTFKSPPG